MGLDRQQMHAGSLYTASSSAPFWYRMFGFLVRSDVRLPLPMEPASEMGGDEPAWVFKLVEPGWKAPEPEGSASVKLQLPDGTPATVVHRGTGGVWIRNLAIAACHVAADARSVDVYPEEGVTEEVLGLVLAGQISVFILHRIGYPTLHASAIVTGRGAVAFLGPKGQGKSTMAAYFLRQGATLLTDDVLPLESRHDGIYGIPSQPTMKIWPPTTEHTLGLTEELSNLIPEHVAPGYDKKLLLLEGRFAFAQQPARILGLYILDRYDSSVSASCDVEIRTLSGREGLIALIDQISFGAFLQPAEVARFLPLYAQLARQAPVRLLRFPDGAVHHEAVQRHVIEDIAECMDNDTVNAAVVSASVTVEGS